MTMTYGEMGDAADKLLSLARRLSRNDSEIAGYMLLLTAAAIAPDRETFIAAAEFAFDEVQPKRRADA